MTDQGIEILGIPIPSSSTFFLTTVGVHVAAGLTCAVSGIVAMVSSKRPGRHPSAGSIYFWSLAVVFASMTILSFMRWPHDVHLLILGVLSFAAGITGRAARRDLWVNWPRVHIAGMGLSYILLLTAFYVDNGPNLPGWRYLPTLAYWLAPSVVGLPILLWALLRHPLVRR